MSGKALKEKDLKLSRKDFDALWEKLDKTQTTTKNVSVPKDALTALLMDHSTLVDAAISRM